jgi:N-acetylglucosaminyl-diphospho-decaprenol L-rhamnosyltransferase
LVAAEPKLTAVVVSYNVRALLAACLESLLAAAQAAPDVPMRVLVVDNASRDGSPDLVRERFPGVELRALERNLGYGGGANAGIREATTPYVLLLNPDTEMRGDAPAAMARFLERHPSAGLVGPRLVYPNGSFQHSAFAFPNLAMSFLDFFPINHRLTGSRLNGRYPRVWYQRPFRVGHPLGACMCARRATLDQIGGFDEGFFMYAEEVDLCWRIARAGWEVWYTPDATVVHHEGASTRQFRSEMLVQLHKSRARFFALHYGRAFVLGNRAIVRLGILRDLARAALDRGRGRLDAEEWRERCRTYARVLAS